MHSWKEQKREKYGHGTTSQGDRENSALQLTFKRQPSSLYKSDKYRQGTTFVGYLNC